MATDFNDKQIRILHVAEKLFAEKGFDGTSIRDIAKEAQVNIAMVSYYFGSKQKMLESLIYFRTADLRMQLDNLIHEPISPLEKINKLVTFYIERIHKNNGIYRIVYFELSSAKRAIDIKSFTDVKRKNLDSLRQIIQEGQKTGVFNKNVEIELIPPTILGTFFHFHMNKVYNMELLQLKTDADFENYLKNNLTKHIQQTIKAILTNESE